MSSILGGIGGATGLNSGYIASYMITQAEQTMQAQMEQLRQQAEQAQQVQQQASGSNDATGIFSGSGNSHSAVGSWSDPGLVNQLI